MRAPLVLMLMLVSACGAGRSPFTDDDAGTGGTAPNVSGGSSGVVASGGSGPNPGVTGGSSGSGGFAGGAGSGGVPGSGGIAAGPAFGGNGAFSGAAGFAGVGAFAGAAGVGGGAGSPGLGGTCRSATDCAAGLECVTLLAEGDRAVVNGLCTLPCDPAALDADCDSVEPRSLCVSFSETESYCMEGCFPQSDLGCSDRDDSFCMDLSPAGSGFSATACVPFCSRDQQCGLGVCNHETGFCSSTDDPGTLPLGAACTAAAAGDLNPPPDSCADGLCVSIDAGSNAGVCTALCRGDVVPQCGWDGSSESPPALCLTTLSAGLLGVALCRKTCACDTDCGNPAMGCYAEPALEQLGVTGYCAQSDGLPMLPCQ
jgi:hypothetical protein